MGFTPLEGISSGTRIGTIDASAVIYLAKKSGKTLNELESYFNSRCGLLGLSGTASDIRELLDKEKASDRRAALALESFVYQIKKYIGAYSAELGGLDMLVFSATIGERSFIMRNRICENMEYLGIKIDQKKNNSLMGENDGFISGSWGSMVKVAAVCTDEMREIASRAE